MPKAVLGFPFLPAGYLLHSDSICDALCKIQLAVTVYNTGLASFAQGHEKRVFLRGRKTNSKIALISRAECAEICLPIGASGDVA